MHARRSKSHKHILKCMDLHTDALCVYVCLGLGLCFCFSLILFPLFLSLSVYPSVCLSSLWLGNQKVKRTSYNLVSKEALFFPALHVPVFIISFPFAQYHEIKQRRRGSWTKFSIYPYIHISVCSVCTRFPLFLPVWTSLAAASHSRCMRENDDGDGDDGHHDSMMIPW